MEFIKKDYPEFFEKILFIQAKSAFTDGDFRTLEPHLKKWKAEGKTFGVVSYWTRFGATLVYPWHGWLTGESIKKRGYRRKNDFKESQMMRLFLVATNWGGWQRNGLTFFYKARVGF